MALDPIAGVTWCKRYSAGNRSILEDVPVSPTPAKPEYLYAWTDSSSNAETLYAWYNDYDGPGAPSDANRVIYTTTPNPTINSTLYDSNKNIITLGDGISSASDSAITIQYLPSDY